MTSEIQFLSTPAQLSQADELCSPLRWGITLKDWEFYAKYFTVYGILDLQNDKVIATSVLYPQGSLVTLGAVIVHPQFRKRGLAKKLVSYAIEFAERDPKITRLGLLGSGMGAPIYSSLGFQTIGLTRVWEGKVDSSSVEERLRILESEKEATGNQVTCPVVSDEDWEKVYQVTKKSFYQAERRVLLDTCGYGPSNRSKVNSVGSIPLTCLITSGENGQPLAFGVIRPFPFPTSSSEPPQEFLHNSELRINLLVASSSHLAKQVFLNLLKGLPEATKIRIEVQFENDGEEEEEEWKKGRKETSVKESLRFLLNDLGWNDRDGNKIMIYKCGTKDGKEAGGQETRWEQEGFRQFSPFDAL